jgi:hypothetical protein
MFHARGRFKSPDGRRFDYIFPEVAHRPDLPLGVIPYLDQLTIEGVQFTPRMGRQRESMKYWNLLA